MQKKAKIGFITVIYDRESLAALFLRGGKTMRRKRVKRDMPLSVLLSEEEDDKLNRLVDIFGMDSRSDTIRKLIVLAYDSSEMSIKEVYK